MGSINAVNPKVDLSVRVYDDFYGFNVEVDANTYDVVFSYFKTLFTDQDAAGNFTISLFRIAQQTNVPVLEILSSFENMTQLQVTAQLAYYLNALRSSSTLLGINSAVTPNQFAARNVLP